MVFILLLAMGIFLLGEQRPLDVGWTALGMAVAGVAIAGWWKFGLTGKHLTAAEVFQDVLASGLLAVSASPLAILQPPASWSELLLLEPDRRGGHRDPLSRDQRLSARLVGQASGRERRRS